jgi:hypothetical protein
MITEMANGGSLPAKIKNSKSVIESASGKRMWELLRILSD